jgi:hypothetical protein
MSETISAANAASFLSYGYNVIESQHMTKTVTDVVDRTWGERLFSWPWRPLQKTRVVITKIPSDEVLVFQNNIVCHPAMADQIRKVVKDVSRLY